MGNIARKKSAYQAAGLLQMNSDVSKEPGRVEDISQTFGYPSAPFAVRASYARAGLMEHIALLPLGGKVH